MSQREVGFQSQDSIENIKFVAEKCVTYIVNRDGCKIPIKRATLAKFVASFQMEDINPRKLDTVLSLTNSLLKGVYGYKLVQIDARGGPQFITVLDSDEGPPHRVDSGSEANNALLVACLIHIFMSGGALKEEALYRFLERSGLMNQQDQTKRTLTHVFTKQAYLTYSKVGEPDNYRYMFEWGQRAHEEFPKLKLLEKLGEVFDRSPDYWYEQHKQATPAAQVMEN